MAATRFSCWSLAAGSVAKWQAIRESQIGAMVALASPPGAEHHVLCDCPARDLRRPRAGGGWTAFGIWTGLRVRHVMGQLGRFVRSVLAWRSRPAESEYGSKVAGRDPTLQPCAARFFPGLVRRIPASVGRSRPREIVGH